MRLQVLAQGFAEDSHAGAVDDADVGESGKEGAVEEVFDFGGGLVDVAADDVDLGGGSGVFVAEATLMPLLRAALTGVTDCWRTGR